jgi:hypothetical protein
MEDIRETFGSYFEILSPRDRRLMFEELDGLDDETREFCRKLYRERYQDHKEPDRRVDNWLWKVVYLPGVYKRRKFIGKAIRNEADGTLSELHLEAPENLTDMQKTVLYHEFRNVARRYLSTCNGANYGSRLLGLKKATDEQKNTKACEDIWMASRGFALASGEEKRLSLWCDAFCDELISHLPSGQEHIARLEKGFKK